MSNEVYGFCDFLDEVDDIENNHLKFQSLTNLGFEFLASDELYNFPQLYKPSTNSISFILGDVKGKRNATYLIDYIDYVDGADIKMPLKAKDRVRLLIDFVEKLFSTLEAKRVVIALTDSSQIEEVKTVERKDFLNVLLSDLEKLAPPDILYELDNTQS